jgi:hypothetical protein
MLKACRRHYIARDQLLSALQSWQQCRFATRFDGSNHIGSEAFGKAETRVVR